MRKAQLSLESKIAFILMKAGVPPDWIDDCVLWAFGPDAWYDPIYPGWVDRWHTLHPRAFKINAKKDKFVEWIFVVGHLYLQYRKATPLVVPR
uniref:Uncharacterized protein n=1 Tax=viral metagenome TaxID=1070528 RepID=A0A6M3IY61_9ZZZZ